MMKLEAGTLSFYSRKVSALFSNNLTAFILTTFDS
jgi:hypothetical protein